MPDARPALEALDKLLAERPDHDTHDFSEATRRLTRLREALLREWGGPPEEAARRRRLARLNAVISVVYGTHYPIGSPKWEHLQRARDDFAALAPEL
jgi:hypothetical protein